MKYTTIFSSEVKPVVSEERDKYLALASSVEVAQFLPEIDAEKNVDLLPVAFNAFVANRVNKNGDVVDTKTAMAFHKDFKNKPINIEHNRDRVIGTILTAGFSEFGSDKPLSEEEVEKMEGPFNVTLGGVVWKIVNRQISDLIESSGDPTSEDYMKISASWELGFSEYNLVLLEGSDKNIENGLVVDNEDEVASMEKDLKALGGEGKTKDGMFVYRKVVGDVVPLGIGLTETPAADVKGVATKDSIKAEEENFAEVQETSQKQQNIVINQNEDIAMKIESIKEITDDSLKQLSASAVSDFIESELKEASERFSAEKHAAEKALKEAQDRLESVSTDSETLKTELDSVREELSSLKTEKEQRESEELFNQRMASLDEAYVLEDEDRKVLASQIKELDEENWESFSSNVKVLLRDKSREVLANKEEENKAEEVVETTNASEETSENIVEDALDRGEATAEVVPASTEASELSTYDKFKDAFSVEQFDIKF
jgi:hypothetical protein